MTDVKTGAVQDAQVTATNVATGVRYTGATDSDGLFLLMDIVPGIYQVEITKPGFKSVLKPDVVLHIESAVALNFTLPFGSISESVTVFGGAPLIGANPGSIGSVIEGRQVTELPLNGRNFTQLALLTPGVTRGAFGNVASGGTLGTNAETYRNSETGSAALSVNGLRPQADNYLLDGLDNNESLVNTIVLFPPAEAIQEFRVSTSVAPAKFGRAGGAIVETSLKSGTNGFHGSLYEFLRNSIFDANDAYFSAPGASSGNVAKLPFHRNQFGGTIGGPLRRNRLFFFADYQAILQHRFREPLLATVPSPLMRQGDFSELLGTGMTTTPNSALTGCAGTLPINGGIYDPLTCQQFPGNKIPSDRQNPVALRYLSAFPLPNIPGRIENNYAAQQHENRLFNDFDMRLDYAPGSSDQIFARYSYAHDQLSLTSLFPALPAGFGSGTNPTHIGATGVGYTRKFTSNLLNDLRFGYTSDFFAYRPPFDNIPLAQQLGIPDANRTSLLGGGALIGGNNSELQFSGDGGPYIVNDNSGQIQDTVSRIQGRHTFAFGFNAIERRLSFYQGNYAKGYFAIDGTQFSGSGRFTGYDVSELLAGFTDYEIGVGLSTFHTRNWESGYFAQDTWHPNDRLTLNYGLRYDLFTNPTERDNRQSNFDLPTGRLIEAGDGVLPRSLVLTDLNNLAPRIGFAYSLQDRLQSVVSGGYGIFYFPDRGGVGNQLSNNPEFNGVDIYQAASGYRITLSGSAAPGSSNSSNASGPLPAPGPVINPAAPRNATVIAIPPHNQTSNVQQWNLQLQSQWGTSTATSLAYVGYKADHLMTWFNFNNQMLAAIQGASLYPGTGLVVNVGSASGTATDHGLQAQITRRLSEGLQYTASYTWSHAISNSSGPFDSNSRIFILPGKGADLRLNRGNSPEDRRHFFSFSSLYEFPFGRSRRFGANWGRGMDNVLGGWQWNNIVTLGTGAPFDILVNGLPMNRPDYIGDAHNGALTPLNGGIRWIAYSAFAMPPVNSSGVYIRPGSLGNDHFHGPGVTTWDTSIFKNFDLSDRLRLELRAEAYNIMNTPQFGNPDLNWNDGPYNFGIIRSTRPFSERQLQFAVRISF